MRFIHKDTPYELDFKREYKDVRFVDANGVAIEGKSKFPYTTVTLWKLLPATVPEPFRVATVGAHHSEQYSTEKGRIYALRLITKTLSKELRAAMWKAYMQRKNVVVKPKTEVPNGPTETA